MDAETGQIVPGYCGEPRELRPYGKGGLAICVVCGMKPGRAYVTFQEMRKRLWRIVFNRWVKHPKEQRA